MSDIRTLAVFCASSPGASPAYALAATRFGELLAREGITLVYGGGRVGLMGAVADGALSQGGRVIGVIPQGMVEAEKGHTGLSELRIVQTMHQRKSMMADLSDAFVALPGGFGTFDELFEIITWAQLGFHTKPIGLLDVEGFWGPFNAALDGVVAAGFIQPRFRALPLCDRDAPTLLRRLRAHTPPAGSGWNRPSEQR